jgi:hypothetical protein
VPGRRGPHRQRLHRFDIDPSDPAWHARHETGSHHAAAYAQRMPHRCTNAARSASAQRINGAVYSEQQYRLPGGRKKGCWSSELLTPYFAETRLDNFQFRARCFSHSPNTHAHESTGTDASCGVHRRAGALPAAPAICRQQRQTKWPPPLSICYNKNNKVLKSSEYRGEPAAAHRALGCAPSSTARTVHVLRDSSIMPQPQLPLAAASSSTQETLQLAATIE